MGIEHVIGLESCPSPGGPSCRDRACISVEGSSRAPARSSPTV